MFQFRNVVASALLFASVTPGFAQDGSLKRIQDAKSIRIGFANEAPFSFQLPDGSLSGADFEVAKAIFGKLGVTKFEGVLVNFGALIPGLNAGRFDVVAAGLYVRKERCAQVLFGDPNIVVGDSLIVPAGNPKKLHSFKDISNNPSLRLGGTIGGLLVKNAIAAGVPESQITDFPDVTSSLAALKAGRTDGAMQTSVTARWTISQSGDKTIEVADPFLAIRTDGSKIESFTSFAFAKADQSLRDAFNVELAKFIGTPEHVQILAKYGMTKSEIPNAKIDKLCE